MADKYLLFTSHIKEAYPSMTKKERRIADYMLLNPEKLLDATAEEIGSATDSSAATVIRFCRTCRFNGLAELKLSLKKENRLVDPNPIHSTDTSPKSDDAVMIVKQRVLGYHNLVINNMLSSWNISAYNLAADAILEANHIIICGEGGSRSTAYNLFYNLLNMKLNCDLYQDSVFEIMKAGCATPNDVVIAISYTGRIKNTIDTLICAKEQGACTISITGILDSPIINYTDIVLNTTSVEKEYYDSELSVRISENVVVEILCTLLSIKRKNVLNKDELELPYIAKKRI